MEVVRRLEDAGGDLMIRIDHYDGDLEPRQ